MANSDFKRKKINSLYVGKSTFFKIFLLAGVVVISLLFIWYTFDVIDILKEDTRTQVEKYVKLWQLAANADLSSTELQFIFDEVIVKASFPIIVLDAERVPKQHRNIDDIPNSEYTPEMLERLQEISNEMVRSNGEFPLVIATETDTIVNYFCYGDSEAINELKVMPFIEIGIILIFMIVAMVGFQNIRKSEERLIWVGMAKETAHQLGTPISSLMGWLEVIQSEKDSGSFKGEEEELIDDTLTNMKVDVVRLQKVANRFGKIGSIPDLEMMSLTALVQDAVEYYRRRLPFEGGGIKIEFEKKELPHLLINPELFGWALENMIKNALQAVDSKTGRIKIDAELSSNGKYVSLLIADNGKGISATAARKIFRAGFTTKKRGWGLGLTLVKRIIEEYHGGKIFLKKSKPGESVFEIQLPVEQI
ncbi:MAG: sensor histidine kinase [Calditrichaeota bacterium]|nr:MAG: sensor histidine kinase [Calditrichota bacterium]